jgi:hypothetical protein
MSKRHSSVRFLLLPAYVGVHTLREALRHPAVSKVLWLEILFNDSVGWRRYVRHAVVRRAYEKAAIWYNHFRNTIEQVRPRRPLPLVSGEWDKRDYQRFVEAVNFLATQT